jgi:ribosomal protein L11 methyltransferase
MKGGLLWQVAVEIAPEAEEAVGELLHGISGRLPSVQVNAQTGRMLATVYLEKASEWSAQCRSRLRSGLARIRACGLDLGPGRISARRILREDWAESWKRHFRPLEIGTALLVRPGWSRRRPRHDQAEVVLNPGLSFGTGQHPTTLFCLEQIVAARKPDTDQSLLDIGTGSGILAIAATKLGFRPVHGFDIDPDAIRIARENAQKNRALVRFRRLDLTTLPICGKRRYSVICANLTHDLLITQALRIVNRLRPDGYLILAGILRSQFKNTCRAFERSSLRLACHRSGGEWESGAFVFAG